MEEKYKKKKNEIDKILKNNFSKSIKSEKEKKDIKKLQPL